jgi:hypothetical protein
MKRLSKLFIVTVLAFIILGSIFMVNNFWANRVHAMGDLPNTNSAQKTEFEKKQQNVNRLMKKQPGTPVPFSIDRYILDQRNTRFNDPTKMSYLYVCFMDGTWIEMTIIAKAASTSKRLSSPVQPYRLDLGANYGTSLGPAPDDMGTYGSSVGDKCAMTTIGSLVEWGGFVGFIWSETPLYFSNMKTQMVKVEVKASPEELMKFKSDVNTLKSKFGK